MKRKKQMWMIFILLLCLLLSSCTGEQKDAGDKPEFEDKQGSLFTKEKQKAQNQKNTIEKKEGKEEKQNETSYKKLDKEKDLVFLDPNIETFEFKPYKTEDGVNQDMMVVKVPNINIKSENVEYFNKQMNAFSKYLIENYKREVEAKHYWSFNTEYRVYQKDDILSVIIFSYYPHEADYKHLNEYHMLSMSAINIDLKTGKKISDKELLERFKIDDLEGALEASIRDSFKMENLKFEEEMDYIHLAVMKNSIAGSLFKLWSELYGNKFVPSTGIDDELIVDADTSYWAIYKEMHDLYPPVLYYSEEDDALMVNMMFFAPAGAGYHFKSVDPSKFKQEEPVVNPSYEYYAKKLGIDPDSEDAPLFFSGFIGYLNDESAGFMLQSAVTYAGVELEKLSKMKSEQYMDGRSLIGDEMYLIIPKHDDISLGFSAIRMDESGQEEKFDPYFTLGNTFVLCNISDLYSDYEILGLYKTKHLRYRPQVSLKDGKNVVIDGVVDITDILKEEGPLKSNRSDEFISEFKPKG